MNSEFDDVEENEENNGSGESFADMFEESLKGLKTGEVVEGSVVEVSNDIVVVDIGYKSEGIIQASEFTDTRGNLEVKVGDKVDVYIVKSEDKEGKPILSRQRARGMETWKEVETAADSGKVFEGRITDVIKGGYFVDIKGLKAFLPGSQIDLRPVREMHTMIGKVFDFKVLKVDRLKNNIIVSRRALLEENREGKRQDAIDSINEGDVVKGIVKNLTNYGAFLEIEGVDGLLHITDMSWGRVNHPSDVVTVGDEVEVKVLKFDKEKVRLTLGMKQLTPDPWSLAANKYPVGSRVRGKVVSLMDYGFFAELEEGFEGLVHISEMSWTKKLRHPSQMVNVGDEVEVVVLDVDRDSRRISLGLKQVDSNPWDQLEEKYPAGTKVKGTVKNITDFGIFIGFDEGIDGLIHVSDMSWTKKIKEPSEVYNVGDEVEAVVLSIDRQNEKFSLGIKQLEQNPWDVARKEFKKGTVATGKVSSVTEFGIFIELAEGVEGLIRQSDFGSSQQGAPKDVFKVGDEVTALVSKVNNKERRIALSIREMEEVQEKAAVEEYVAKQGDQSATLGDILNGKLKKED